MPREHVGCGLYMGCAEREHLGTEFLAMTLHQNTRPVFYPKSFCSFKSQDPLNWLKTSAIVCKVMTFWLLPISIPFFWLYETFLNGRFFDKHMVPMILMTSCSQKPCTLKGSVKWKKRGGVSGINRWALYYSIFLQIFYCFLKDPGPLNHKKRISAA